jgi:hypothetical protein
VRTTERRADLAFFLTALAALLILTLLGALQRRLELVGEDDFSRIWAGPRAFLDGHDPYDPASWLATTKGLGTQTPDTPVYIYPPWVILVLLPLAALPLNVATIVWLAGSVVAGLAGLRALLRASLPGMPLAHALAVAMLLLSWVGALSLVIGQWGFFLVAALSVVASFLRTRPLSAGAAAVALIAKPQLFTLAAPATAAHALWADRRAGVRFIAAAAGLTAVLVAVAWAVVPSWWPTWLVRIGGVQLGPDSDTIPGLLFALFGPGGPAFAPLVVLPLVAVGLAFHPRAPAWGPVWLVLSLVAAPYTNSYDQLVLVVPIVVGAGVALRRSARAAWLVLGSGAALLIGLTPLMYEIAVRRHSETFGVVVPLLLFAVLVAVLWPVRRAS